MTSRVSECFVYMTLPDQIDPVTAGRFVITPDRQGLPTGRFVYGRRYLARSDAVPFDPIDLKLTDKTYETTTLNGVFGALRDAGPDYWGRRLIERYLDVPQLSEIEYLLNSPDDRAGALGFGLNQTPPAPKRKFNQTIDLANLQAIADALIRDEDTPPTSLAAQAVDLMLAGTSMGGARPKAVVEFQNALWLAKFNRFDDKWNNARVEQAMLLLARACGLQTAESHLTTVGDRDVLLVKRFDRAKKAEGYTRTRMISALTLLRAEDTYQSRDRWSYILFVEELRRVSAAPLDDAKELFGRMVFNALISNTDDHPRNHALIANPGWRLSPAYDLTPSALIGQDHRDLAMICGDRGRGATVQNLLSQASRFCLTPDEAQSVLTTLMGQVHSGWYSTMRSAGVSEKDCGLLKTAFVYPGLTRAE
jgi:serine/threonine-protein kinase HipA